MRGTGVLTLALASLALSAASAGAAEPGHTVPWTAAAGVQAQGEQENAPPAGANDWSCKPSPRHPEPVVLVHGLFANRTTNFSTLSPFLANRGYCVFALTYGTRDDVDWGVYQPGGLIRMQESAKQLRGYVDRVVEATGAQEVDIVGHSQGSLMPNYYVRFLGGAAHVDDYVGITPLWDGTNTVGLSTIDTILRTLLEPLGVPPAGYDVLESFCSSCRQFVAGSSFMRKMNSRGGPREPGVNYTMIMTRNDELVVPWQSGYMDGATNHVVQEQCALDQSEHLSIAFDPITAHDVWNALEPARRQHEVPCVPVLPFVGAAGYSGD